MCKAALGLIPSTEKKEKKKFEEMKTYVHKNT
jgi:hypothetical protein